MGKQDKRVELYRNEQGQLVLHVAVKNHIENMAHLYVSGFVLDSERRKLLSRAVSVYSIDLKQDPLTKAELVEAVRNLAQMYALQMGEPDFDIVSNPPLLKQEPIIKMKKEKSDDIFKTF